MFERTIEPRMTRRNDHEKREKRFSRRKLINSTTVCQPVIETRGRRHKGPFAGLYFPHLSITPYRFFAFSQLSIKMISEIGIDSFAVEELYPSKKLRTASLVAKNIIPWWNRGGRGEVEINDPCRNSFCVSDTRRTAGRRI